MLYILFIIYYKDLLFILYFCHATGHALQAPKRGSSEALGYHKQLW